MKKVIFSVFAIALSTAAIAQDQATIAAPAAPITATATPVTATIADANIAVSAQDDKKQVEASALPEAIKKVLATDQYKQWTVASAWLVKGEKEHYELQMKKGEETTSLKFDKDGNVVS